MSRHADDERVPAAEAAGEHDINHVLLADDDLGDLAENLLARLAELLDGLERVGRGVVVWHLMEASRRGCQLKGLELTRFDGHLGEAGRMGVV